VCPDNLIRFVRSLGLQFHSHAGSRTDTVLGWSGVYKGQEISSFPLHQRNLWKEETAADHVSLFQCFFNIRAVYCVHFFSFQKNGDRKIDVWSCWEEF
jgi:hypothetical protein